jgi:hypothetical protein
VLLVEVTAAAAVIVVATAVTEVAALSVEVNATVVRATVVVSCRRGMLEVAAAVAVPVSSAALPHGLAAVPLLPLLRSPPCWPVAPPLSLTPAAASLPSLLGAFALPLSASPPSQPWRRMLDTKLARRGRGLRLQPGKSRKRGGVCVMGQLKKLKKKSREN